MKAKTFEKLLRKIIREEIDYSLQRELRSLKEDLRNEFKSTIVEQSTTPIVEQSPTPITKTTKTSLKEKIMGKKPFSKHNFVKNNTLNDLLNETAQGDTNTATALAPVSIDQPFASGAPLPMDTAGMPEEVANAVTRDYSGLMKAIKNKKGR